MTESRFKGVLGQRQRRQEGAQAQPEQPAPAVEQQPAPVVEAAGQVDQVAAAPVVEQQPAPVVEQQPARGPGRPPGKRKDPAYRQVSAQVRGDTYDHVMVKLRLMKPRRDFGDLVQELLASWLESQPKLPGE